MHTRTGIMHRKLGKINLHAHWTAHCAHQIGLHIKLSDVPVILEEVKGCLNERKKVFGSLNPYLNFCT